MLNEDQRLQFMTEVMKTIGKDASDGAITRRFNMLVDIIEDVKVQTDGNKWVGGVWKSWGEVYYVDGIGHVIKVPQQ